MMKSYLKISLFTALMLMLSSCNPDTDLIEFIEMRYNLTKVAPLTAQLELRTSRQVAVEVRVVGKRGAESDIIFDFPSLSNDFSIPVLGLYPGASNTIEVTLREAGGAELEKRIFEIVTRARSENLPEITIDQAPLPGSKPGFNLVNYFGHSTGRTFIPQTTFMFDQFGDIRWYLDYLPDPVFRGLFYDNGLSRLVNGNLLMGDRTSSSIYEINMQGVAMNTWILTGYDFHHQVIEKPNFNLLLTASSDFIPTVEDYILEISSKTGNPVRDWNLNESLDSLRRVWDTDLADTDIDWFHANGLAFNEEDNTIIVSGRTQGTVKLNKSNELVWILAPHKGWETNGRGEDLNQYLLQPLDANGNPILDQAVLEGDANHPDFEWAWYQHSPVIMPNGNLMLFDNGDNRNYTQPGTYSRAVEYKIDEENMTIQQVWTYGKERGQGCYSRIVSAVAYHPEENTVLFTPGAIVNNGESYGKVIELDYATKQVLFEATITPPVAPFNITFHNVKRMSLYP
ncbi:MAG: aryl-sulfate sulfotransferase [Bacteroidia bacterium]|nr:aryl-sulfate sulfotransferase [Bacteroidia bacterium]